MEEADKSKRTEYFKPLQNIEHFWRWDLSPEAHKKEYEKNVFYRGDVEYSRCCFNHAIGLPVKVQKDDQGIIRTKVNPIFQWQKDKIFDELEEHPYVWCIKATGMGVTEFMLRYMSWKALTHPFNQMTDAIFCIVTGPNIDLAKKLMERLKGLFKGYSFPERDVKAIIGNMVFEAFPSHHLDSMRGLPNVRFILLDEADFFPIGQQDDARNVSERYIGKSDTRIVMVSTPNLPGGLYERIQNEEDSIYHKMFLRYTLGEGTIYTKKELEEAKKSPSFKREYDLEYGYGLGNVFLEEKLQAATKKFDQLFKEARPMAEGETVRAMGVDPAFGSSRFAIVVLEMVDGILRVIHADEYERPSYETMIPLIMHLYRDVYRCQRMLIDENNPSVIKSLKEMIEEDPDYTSHQPLNQKHKGDYRYVNNMEIIPVSFLSHGREMLGQAKMIMDRELIAIPSTYKKLIDQLRVSKTDDSGKLDKTGHPLDLVDAFRLACWNFSFGSK